MIDLVRRYYLVLLVLILAALLQSACYVATPVQPPPTNTPVTGVVVQDPWERIQETGIMVVGTSADYPPFESYNRNFQLDGFDIALIQEIAENLGVRVDIKDLAFEGLTGALQLGHIDVAIAAISQTPEREEIVDFSQIYLVSEDAILAKADSNIDSIRTVEDLADYKVGVQVSSVYADWLYDNLVVTGLMPSADLFIYADADQAVGDLADGRVDMVVLDLLPAERAVEAGGVKLVGQGLNKQRLAIAMPKGATTLQTEINDALTELQNDGRVAELVEEYLELDPEDQLPIPRPTPQLPMPTVVPQATPTPVPAIDSMAWVEDLNNNDNNMTTPPEMAPGQRFSKGWRVLNNGTTTWDSSYTFAYVQGDRPADRMSGQPVSIQGQVAPGQTHDIWVNLIAPTAPGTYQGFWQMHNGQGQPFGARVWVGIKVPAPPTPVPVPTPTPSASISFVVDRTQIKAGECVTFSWNVSNVREVYFYAEGEDWEDHGVTGQESRTECPSRTTTYYLRVHKTDGTVETPSIPIYVEQVAGAPVITNFSVSPGGQITLGQCVNVSWEVQGQVDRVMITRDDVPWDGAPLRGNFQDCPQSPGEITYILEAFGPGGTSRAVQQLQVVQPMERPEVKQLILSAGGEQNVEQIPFGQCVQISWEYTAQDLTRSALMRDEDNLLTDPPLSGSHEDCPPAQGNFVYSLQVKAAGGSDVEYRSLRVVGPR